MDSRNSKRLAASLLAIGLLAAAVACSGNDEPRTVGEQDAGADGSSSDRYAGTWQYVAADSHPVRECGLVGSGNLSNKTIEIESADSQVAPYELTNYFDWSCSISLEPAGESSRFDLRLVGEQTCADGSVEIRFESWSIEVTDGGAGLDEDGSIVIRKQNRCADTVLRATLEKK